MTSGSPEEPNPIAASQDWHSRLCEGDPVIASHLWETYFERMVLLARKRLRGARSAARDEEDVALSAFKSFCLGVQAGRILLDEHDSNLWPLLVKITMNKAVDEIRFENRKKRSSRSSQSKISSELPNVDEVVGHEPTPELLAAASESFERLLQSLDRTDDNDLREIAIATMEGSSASEIASAMNCSSRTIQRKLKTIRGLWLSEVLQ
ncbi:MAG: ECF-type sigma factor [Rubripirellula sp.]